MRMSYIIDIQNFIIMFVYIYIYYIYIYIYSMIIYKDTLPYLFLINII